MLQSTDSDDEVLFDATQVLMKRLAIVIEIFSMVGGTWDSGALPVTMQLLRSVERKKNEHITLSQMSCPTHISLALRSTGYLGILKFKVLAVPEASSL